MDYNFQKQIDDLDEKVDRLENELRIARRKGETTSLILRVALFWFTFGSVLAVNSVASRVPSTRT